MSDLQAFKSVHLLLGVQRGHMMVGHTPDGTLLLLHGRTKDLFV
jgi:hypothetical protein